MRGSMLRFVTTAIASAAIFCPVLAQAQSEAVTITAVAGTGCDNDQFHVTVARSHLVGNPYSLHFVASVAGLVYTNQSAPVSTDGSSDCCIYSNFSVGSVPNEGSFPMPAGQPIQADVALEPPVGKVVTSWRMVVDGCDTGNITLNSAVNSAGTVSTRPVSALDPAGIALLGALLAAAFAWRRRSRRRLQGLHAGRVPERRPEAGVGPGRTREPPASGSLAYIRRRRMRVYVDRG